MDLVTKKQSKNWEERGRILSRRLYYLEFVLFVASLGMTTFVCFSVLEESSFFKKTMVLLFGIGGISSFHFLFHKLWELWAELHDRMIAHHPEQKTDEVVDLLPPVQSTIKIVLSSEEDSFREKHGTFLQRKVSALSGRPCEVVEVKTAVETVSYVTDHVVHLVIMDSHFQKEICFSWAEKIKKVDKNIPVVICSTQEKHSNPFIDAWFSYLQRDTDVEKLLPYFIANRTKNGTRGAKR